MSGLGVLIVIAFVVIAVFDNLRKMGQGTTAPRGGSRLPPRPPGPPYAGQGQGRPGGGASAESAETLLPEDLWALLTGQQRPSAPRPLPPPAPVPAEAREAVDLEDGDLALESSSFEVVTPASEPMAAAPDQLAPQPVPAVAVAPAAAPGAPRPAPARSPAVGLRARRDLRRAMALQVILGPPRSLE